MSLAPAVPRLRGGLLRGVLTAKPRPVPGATQEPWWQDWRLTLSHVWAVLLVCLVAGAVVSYALRNKLLESVTEVQRLREALIETAELLTTVLELDDGQRDLAEDGDRSRLQATREEAAQMATHLARVQNLLGADPQFSTRLEILGEDLRRRQAEVATMLARSPPLLMPPPEVSDDGLRQSLVAIERELRQRLGTRERVMHERFDRRTTSLYGTLLLAMVAALFALWMLRRYVHALEVEANLRLEVLESQRESRAKSRFVANMSHEIRTPLNAIFGFTRLLHDRLGDPVSRRYIEAIAASGRSLLDLLDDFMDISKIAVGKLEIRNGPVSLREVADGVMAVFTHLAEAKNLQLTCKVADTVPEGVLLDGGRLRQSLFNLVGNAIKYTNSGSVHLRIRARFDANPETVTLVIDVRDSGIGIEQDELIHIFDPFTRGRQAAAGKPGGAGLGLAITRQIVELMGGQVAVRSQPGRGSVFRITLPEVKLARIEPVKPQAQGLLSSLPRCLVLIVDDIKLNRELLEAMFSGSHHRTLTAANGPEALLLACTHQPDLILLDLRMPDMDGDELLGRLRSEPTLKHSRVVAVTATNFDDGSLADYEGFDGYVAKPIAIEALHAELARVLADREAERPQPAPDAAVPAQGTAPSASELERIQGELEQLETNRWRQLLATPVFQDVREFAASLQGLSERAGDGSLRGYAETLRAAAAEFNARRIESLLHEFSGVVRRFQARRGARP